MSHWRLKDAVATSAACNFRSQAMFSSNEHSWNKICDLSNGLILLLNFLFFYICTMFCKREYPEVFKGRRKYCPQFSLRWFKKKNKP